MQKLFDQAFWGRGFRPFFLFGALYGAMSIVIWGGFYMGHIMPPAFFLDPVSWHAHEMIFGFTMAIVAGFLLTAVANWTGGAPARQIHLAILTMLWLAGRLVMNVDIGLSTAWIVFIEVLFVPALAVTLAIPLFRSRNKRNFVFLSFLAILCASDIWFLIGLDMRALYVALMMILMMVSLIGGRIIPAFTVAALRRRGVVAYQTDQQKTDMLALLSLIAVMVCLVFARDGLLLSVAAFTACFIHLWRMRYYHTLKSFSDPMLWILHLGYLWLVIGLGLLGLTGLGIFDIPSVVHALTAGCIGSMILGMLCRVTRGHTGRPLTAGLIMTVAFVAIQIAAIMRVFAPLLWPEHMSLWIITSAFIWSFCFVLYLLVQGYMLLTPRPDGMAP